MKKLHLTPPIVFLCFIATISYLFELNYARELWVILFMILTINVFSAVKQYITHQPINYAVTLLIFFLLFYIVSDQVISILFTGKVSYVRHFQPPSEGIKHEALFLILLFLLPIALSQNFFFTKPTSSFRSICDFQCNHKEALILFIFFIVGMTPFISGGLSSFKHLVLMSRAAGGGSSQFGLVGGGTTIIIFLQNFLVSTALISGYFLTTAKQTRFLKTYNIIIFIFSMLLISSGGTRTRVALVVVPLFCNILFLNRNSTSLKIFAKYFSAIIIVLLLISTMVKARQEGYINIFSSSHSSNVQDIDITGADLGSELYIILNHYPKPLACDNAIECITLPFIDTLNKFITNPIPRSVWQNKYLDPSFASYNLLRTGYSGLTSKSGSNITPTVMGRYYMLYGNLGVLFIGTVFGFSLTYLNKRLSFAKHSSNIDNLLTFCIIFYFCQSLRDFTPGWSYGYIFTFLYFHICNNRHKTIYYNRP